MTAQKPNSIPKPSALDLYCGAGGVSAGLTRAGFAVLGVDVKPQPHYPYAFAQIDALAFLDRIEAAQFDFIWASPPCQKHTAYKRRKNHVAQADCFIAETRELLKQSGKPYVIENVGGAPLKNPVMLCGSMFGLDVRRHRYFEANFPIAQPKCRHDIWTPRYPPATNRKNLRKTVEVGVWRIPLEVQQKAMGIDWMPLERLSQAIPPAYAEYIAKEYLTWTNR